METDPGGPASYLLRHGLVPKNAILLAGPGIRDEDARALADLNVSLVLCPRSFARFNWERFPFSRYLSLGLNLCLGTDSLALCDSLSLFDEMYCLRQEAPELSPEQILSMAVLGGARASGLGRELGQIRPGFLADLIGLEMRPTSGTDLLEEIVAEEREVRFVMVDGREVLA
jgi:cytosine/adenosine deaminase-related metal-dependent hydrolase